MTISYDWYTTNYRHAAVYATLIVKATVYNKPFTLHLQLLLKNKSTSFFKFPGQFHIFQTPGKSIKILDCHGQSRTYGMYAYQEYQQDNNSDQVSRL